MNIDLGGNTLVNGYFAGIVIAPGPSLRWIVVSSDYTAGVGDKIQADTARSPFTITLPAAASIGDKVLIQDAKLTWHRNNLIIVGNGLLINGVSTDYTASVIGNKLSIVYTSTSYGWSIK